MLLAININNSETKLGLFQGDQLEAHWRVTTGPSRTPDEWAAAITSYLTQRGHSPQEVRASIVASVVPPVTQAVDRKSTRLNSSHVEISYAVFCLKKKKETTSTLHPYTHL